MGVSINSYMILKECDVNTDEWAVSTTSIYKQPFPPIDHTPSIVFSNGSNCFDYEIECVSCNLSMPYSTYNRWRDTICDIVIGISTNELYENVYPYLDKPFIELLWFSDAEHCFDYIIAEKLLNDFNEHRDFIISKLEIGINCDYNFLEKYDVFIDILKSCVEKKGIVVYS